MDNKNIEIKSNNYTIDINNNKYELYLNDKDTHTLLLNKQGPRGPKGDRGERGETGNGIVSFELTSSSGLTDTYTVTFTDGNTQEINVNNGVGISNISLSSTEGLVDTYTITYNNNTTSTFNVTNGKNAIISNANATINNEIGTPSVNVITNGTQYDRSFTFEFKNLKGEQGIQGLTGEQGPQGETGPEGPQGIQGPQGLKGDKGDVGPQGPKGDQGIQGIQGEIGPIGPQGEAGPPNVLSIGTVSNGDNAEATITGNSPNQILNLILPKGDKGERGEQGPQGPQGEAGISNIPIGTIIPVNATSNYVPDGSIPCNGAEYSKSQFNNLWDNYLSTSLLNTCTYTEYANDLSTYGQCGKFAVDVENEKFRVPFIKDGAVIQQALTDSELGKSYNAGLPNIEGAFYAYTWEDGTPVNAFTSTIDNPATLSRGHSVGYNYNIFDLNASKSNQIYGNSDTVQPNAISLRYFVVVANGQINQSMMDWSAWASSLQSKANTDLSNLSSTGQAIIDSKQNIIPDLDTIRNGASLGATALQKETDPIYTADKPNIATKDDLSEKQDISTAVTHSANTSVGSSTTPIFVDSNGVATSTDYSIDNSRFDGQWVPKIQVLSQVGTAGVISMDVSSYLPNDGYNYEVLIICGFADNGTNNFRVYSDIIPQPTKVALLCSGNGFYNGSYIVIPVGSERVIYRLASASASANGYHGIEALAYRRIGTNG